MADIVRRLRYASHNPRMIEAAEEIERLRAALEPFAAVGAWLFARPQVPDDAPMVELRGINGSAGVLTRGDFKAAHAAMIKTPNVK